MCRELKTLEIAVNFYVTLPNCHENCLQVFWATMLVTWSFLASFLLHAKYKLFFPVESASVRQRVVFFFLCPSSETRERRK